MTDASQATETTVEQAPKSAAPEVTAPQATQGAAPQAQQAAVSQEAPKAPEKAAEKAPDPVDPADEPPMPDFRSYHDLPNPNTLRGVQAGPAPHPRTVAQED